MLRALRTTLVATVLCAIALPTAAAAGDVGIDTRSVPFADLADDADVVGVSLALVDRDLIIVFGPAGAGDLGDAIVPFPTGDGYPTNALGDVDTTEATFRSGIAVAVPGGFTFVLDAADPGAAAAAAATRLATLGFAVDHAAGDRVVDFALDGVPFRATFASVETGVRVYVGVL